MTRPSALCVTRIPLDESIGWALVGVDSLAGVPSSEWTATRNLEALPVEQRELDTHVESMMAALEAYSSHRATTPGGASWLYVQHVPVRRLVSQLVRKLRALSAWEPFARSPGPLRPAPHEGLINVRESSSHEYRAYTVTWSGIAFALGADTLYNRAYSAGLYELGTRSPDAEAPPEPPPPPASKAEIVALTWSSRHWQTLLPVLEKLVEKGQSGLLVDLASDPRERCPKTSSKAIGLRTAPTAFLASSGTVPELNGTRDPLRANDCTVQVGQHTILLNRLERLAAALVELPGGCTQPSWYATVRTERWLDDLLNDVSPHTVLVSNDTSPLGALGVHVAERHGANTVYVQHGAWVPGSVAWPTLHSRQIVVMGERDVAPAKAWARHPGAEIHVLGQPRFDALDGLRHETQHRYLRKLLTTVGNPAPERIAVWATQPFGPDRLRRQADIILGGLQKVTGHWGLVIAPHPAQALNAFDDLLEEVEEMSIALADPQVGARGCLAGADTVVSASSTCGIEAVLLGVPVLELDLPGERTLGLVDHGLARSCRTADDIASALGALPDPDPRVTKEAIDVVCRWSGSSAADIAQLIVSRSHTAAAPHSPVHHDANELQVSPAVGEGSSDE